MPQSNVIFFYLFAAFVIYITMRGELPVYLGYLFASPKQADTVKASDVAPSSNSTSVADTAKTIGEAAKFAAVFL